MGRPTGGRGHKGAGTTHIRVPLPITEKVRALVAEFYEEGDHKPGNKLPSLDEATVFAQTILAGKKSAKVSLSKLLEAIYGQKVEL
jgi:hypothetical protein